MTWCPLHKKVRQMLGQKSILNTVFRIRFCPNFCLNFLCNGMLIYFIQCDFVQKNICINVSNTKFCTGHAISQNFEIRCPKWSNNTQFYKIRVSTSYSLHYKNQNFKVSKLKTGCPKWHLDTPLGNNALVQVVDVIVIKPWVETYTLINITYPNLAFLGISHHPKSLPVQNTPIEAMHCGKYTASFAARVVTWKQNFSMSLQFALIYTGVDL